MGLRFRKSFKVGPFRTTISKSGISTSIGGKGARVTKTANGRTKTTLSIPGTGISHVSESSSSKNKRVNATTSKISAPSNINMGVVHVLLMFIGILMVALGVFLMLALPIVGIVAIGIGVIEIIVSKRIKKKMKQQSMSLNNYSCEDTNIKDEEIKI